MFNYKVVLEYEGCDFYGLQQQTETENTIHGVVLKAVKKAFKRTALRAEFLWKNGRRRARIWAGYECENDQGIQAK